MLQPTMLKSCLKRNEEAGTKKGPAPRRQHVKIDLTKTGTLEILHRSEMTNDDMAAVWLRAEEYAEFKTNFASVIRRMMKAPNERLEETDECTCRGLESRTKLGSRARKRARSKAIWAVLDEQDIQREEGLDDEAFIASIYREMAGPSSLEALNRGLKDQRAMLDSLEPEIRMEVEPRYICQQQPTAAKDVVVVPLTTAWRGPSIAESLRIGSDMLQSRTLVPAL